MPLGRGDTFGRYVVEEILGAGGGGEVYRAHDTVLNRAVALKVLLADSLEPAPGGQRSRILREARAAAQLSHPNVVAIFDVGEHDGVPYMAMELVPGRSLRACIGAADVPIERRLRWLCDIARALDAAHRRGLIHRDVKPENVIVRDDGLIKVVDFGIARQTVVDPRGPTAVEKTGAASAGTPHYMAPEQIKNEPLDGRADQFGWGVMAYELVSGGSLPWDASGGALKYVTSVVGEDAVPLQERVTIAPDVAAVIERTLRRSKADRFTSMEDVALALDPLRSHSGPDVVRHVVSVLPPSMGLGHEVTTKAPLSGRSSEAGRVLPPAPALSHGARTRPLRFGVAFFALAVLLGLAAVLRMRARRHAGARPSETTTPSGAPVSSPASTAYAPNTTNREALAAYTEGMQALRDGAGYAAISHFSAAVKIDPMLGEADLRLALLHLDREPAMAKASYMRAYALRSVLRERDRGLLDAIEPIVARTESDAAESVRRLETLAERFPRDAEILSDIQLAAGLAGDFAREREAGERVLVVDPDFHAARALIAESQAYEGHFDEALRSVDLCFEKAPDSNRCMTVKTLVLEQRGECSRLEHDARAFLAANQSAGPVFATLAEVMLDRHAPSTAVREALDQHVAAARDDDRPRMTSAVLFRLHVATGAFEAAEKDALDYEAKIAGNPSATLHGVAATRRAELYMETGRSKEAGEVARAWLDARDGYTPDVRVHDEGIANDATPGLLAVERAAGLLGEGSFVAERTAWLARWEAQSPVPFRGYLWLQAYPDAVVGAEDARAALVALDRYGGGIPPYRQQSLRLIGRIYFLAGRLDEAMPWLEADARMCDALNYPFAHVRAAYWLGRGFEARGDVASACATYDEVLARWGDARPRSVTATDARARSRALRCATLTRDP